MDGILKMMARKTVRADPVEKVILGISRIGFPMIFTPKEAKHNFR
jgi:hypothetical protein